MNRSPGLQSLTAMGLAVILASNIFLFVPFTLYVGNLDEFNVSFPTLLSLYFRPAIFLIAALGLVGAILTASVFRRYLVFLAAISVLLWFQGSILVWEYGLLDGRGIDWTEGTWRGWLDLGIWIGVILAAVFFHRRLEKPIIYTAVVTFSLQLTFSLFTGIQSAPTLLENSEIKTSSSTLREMYRFSSHKNVLQIILDGFQSDVFEEIINDDEDGKRLASGLEGFVFFKENLGVFPFTHMTVPAFLSGKIYQNHIPRDQFLKETIGGKTILNVAYNAGYEIDLATEGSLMRMYTKGSYTNAYIVPADLHVSAPEYELDESAKLLDLALFRLAPHFLKMYVYNDQLWLVQSLLSDSKYMRLEFFAHNAFLRYLKENMSADRSTPVYKLFHLKLSHNPMVANKNCEYAGRVLPTVRVTVKTQAKCSLGEVVSLLEKMKELDIYDDALIILMADHGAWVPPAGLIGYIRPDGKSVTVMDPTTVAMALPLMAIKPPGASGSLQISMAPSWIVDTPATIASVLGLNEKFDGPSIFDLRPDEPRERRHYSYEYRRSEWTADYLSPLHEFIINGSVFDTRAWRPGDRFFPNGVVQERSVRTR
ncbi:MAG: hypothetical protein O6950_11550 [Gammaproteobacteria bacterium]|nr:hypothetical protein [Gammaproteobacteria bacterium]